ncbi:MAG: hypothetical protein QY307_08880 [Acidimicrobiia bacterium]|nr:MAG: hypothetical protein QY307_08880 [Acidimicrobiia bacterium]
MIQAARRLHPSMLAVAVVLALGFFAIAAATIVSVLQDEVPSPARIDDLAIPVGYRIMGSHQTCTADACDGEGAVFDLPGRSTAAALDLLAGSLLATGWHETGCSAVEGRCMESNDRRLLLIPWSVVSEEPATAAMRAGVESRSIDQSRLIYVRIVRCGITSPCS